MYKILANVCCAVGFLSVFALMIIGWVMDSTIELEKVQVTVFLTITGVLVLATIGSAVFEYLYLKNTPEANDNGEWRD
jgi:biotin transporter BioY